MRSFGVGEPVAEKPDAENAPEAAGAVDDIDGGCLAINPEGGDEDEGLKRDEEGSELEWAMGSAVFVGLLLF